ncbi:unnamed protein product [Cylicostephanus goldi]|uniref:Uncharacterized protein n=1 Tax=Cylicostephanus goldi TaxID=71465 RepID=A0A3P6QPA1_CYLGO|nr:unnamed protein product [Cylicostephanus goldi]
MVLRDQRHWLTRLCALVPDQVAWRTLLHAVMTFKPSMPLPPVKLPPRCLTHAHRRVYPPETNPIDGKGYSYARGLTRRYSYEASDAVSGLNRGTEWYEIRVIFVNYLNSSKYSRSPRTTTIGGRRYVREVHRRYETDQAPSTYRQHESRLLGSGDSDKRLDDFLPEYLRPPKDPFEEEPRFADSATLPNYLGNPNSIYRLRPHKSGSFGSSENSTGSSSSSNRYNGYFKSSATSTEKATDTEKTTKTAEEKISKSKTTSDEQTLDPLNPVYSTEYVGYSATSDVR